MFPYSHGLAYAQICNLLRKTAYILKIFPRLHTNGANVLLAWLRQILACMFLLHLQ